MNRSIVIAIVCLALSAQAFAWTAMSCCDDENTAAITTHHEMADKHSHCGDDGEAPADDGSPDDCCPGAVCGGASALSPALIDLFAPIPASRLATESRHLANAPPTRLLRPPIA